MVESKNVEFNNIVGHGNTRAFINGAKKVVDLVHAAAESEGAGHGYDAFDAVLEKEYSHVNDLVSQIGNWKDDTKSSAEALGELLMMGHFSRDLRETVSATPYCEDIQNAINTARTVVSEAEGATALFDGLVVQLNEHVSNRHDYLGHKWQEALLDNIKKPAENDVVEEESIVQSPSEKLSLSGEISAETLGLSLDDIQP